MGVETDISIVYWSESHSAIWADLMYMKSKLTGLADTWLAQDSELHILLEDQGGSPRPRRHGQQRQTAATYDGE